MDFLPKMSTTVIHRSRQHDAWSRSRTFHTRVYSMTKIRTLVSRSRLSWLLIVGCMISRGSLVVGFHHTLRRPELIQLLPPQRSAATRLAADLSQPLSFLSSGMTTSNKRRSVRLSSSSNPEPSSKETPVKRKATAAKKKKSTPKTPESVVVPSPSKDTTVEGKPWYYLFTKGDEEYDKYMATEWGIEKRGTVTLFEKISLEGAQSGLSWLTILRKRNAYRRVFYNFDIDKVAAMTQSDVARILAEEDKANTRNLVVRHKGKIESVINNAQCIQRLQNEHLDNPDYFDEFIWSFVDNKPILNSKWYGGNLQQAVAQTKESQAMSKALKTMGFRFVGPTTMYAMMQSCGLVIDHPVNSPEWVAARERLEKRPGGYQEQQERTM